MGNPAHDLLIICSRNFTTIHPVYQFLCVSHFLSVSVFLLCPLLVLLRYDAFVSVCLPQSVCVLPHDIGLCVCYTCNCSLFVSACACLWYCVRSSIRVLLSVYVLSLRVCMCLLRINRISKAELLVSSWMTRLMAMLATASSLHTAAAAAANTSWDAAAIDSGQQQLYCQLPALTGWHGQLLMLYNVKTRRKEGRREGRKPTGSRPTVCMKWWACVRARDPWRDMRCLQYQLQ